MSNHLKSNLAYLLITAISILIILAGWLKGFSGSTLYVNSAELEQAVVESGEFSQKVNGYGSIEFVNKRYITALSSGVVENIALKSGAKVDKDSVLMTLINPQLESSLQQAVSNLHRAKTEARKTDLMQQRELLSQRSQLAKIESELELAQLKLEAQTPLVLTGVISRIEGEKAKLEVKQLTNRVKFENERLQKLSHVHAENLAILEDTISQSQREYELATKQLKQLVITAEITGVLQKISTSTGQNVNIGDELALVGDTTRMFASVKVPQSQIDLIQVGASAEIDTRNELLIGNVERIAPVVVNGAIEVDISLPRQSIASLKPMQSIDVTIFGKSRSGVSAVKRPDNVTQGAKVSVYKLLDSNNARLVEVRFGQISGDKIEILSGLSAGDKIIVSMPKMSERVDSLVIVPSS